MERCHCTLFTLYIVSLMYRVGNQFVCTALFVVFWQPCVAGCCAISTCCCGISTCCCATVCCARLVCFDANSARCWRSQCTKHVKVVKKRLWQFQCLLQVRVSGDRCSPRPHKPKLLGDAYFVMGVSCIT